MAMVRKYGKPDLFLTFTCNPKWREIVENLRPGDSIQNRNDLIARVFRIKINALLQGINVNNILGVPIGHTMVVEFQKRGLPHVHILIILKQGDKSLTDDDYELFVCAEIPETRNTSYFVLICYKAYAAWAVWRCKPFMCLYGQGHDDLHEIFPKTKT